MKKIILMATLLMLPVVSSAQSFVQAATIEPSDFEAYKWIFSATAKKDEVVVFRVTTTQTRGENITIHLLDSVRYFPGKLQEKKAFFFDKNFFGSNNDQGPKWVFKVFSGSGTISGKCVSSSATSSLTGEQKVEITFKDKHGWTTEKVMEVFVKSYDEVKIEYPKLPEITPNTGWGWNVTKDL